MATGLRPFTLPALVATLVGGVVAIIVGRRLAPAVTSGQPVIGAPLWAVLAGAAVVWELLAFFQRPRSGHPTVSSLSNDLLQSHPSRAVALLVWLAAGLWLARR